MLEFQHWNLLLNFQSLRRFSLCISLNDLQTIVHFRLSCIEDALCFETVFGSGCQKAAMLNECPLYHSTQVIQLRNHNGMEEVP